MARRALPTLLGIALIGLAACGSDAPTKTAARGATTTTIETTTTSGAGESPNTTGTVVSGTGYIGPATTVTAGPGTSRTTSTTPVPPAPPTTQPPPLPVNGSGVRGTISAGPTCPVERVDQPCPPRPVSADVDAVGSKGQVAGRTHSDAEGRYALALAPGEYDLRVNTGNRFPTCQTVHVVIRPGEVARADIDCDTGIR